MDQVIDKGKEKRGLRIKFRMQEKHLWRAFSMAFKWATRQRPKTKRLAKSHLTPVRINPTTTKAVMKWPFNRSCETAKTCYLRKSAWKNRSELARGRCLSLWKWSEGSSIWHSRKHVSASSSKSMRRLSSMSRFLTWQRRWASSACK